MLAAPALTTLLSQLGTRVAHAEGLAAPGVDHAKLRVGVPSLGESPPLSLGAPLDDALPDGGLPRGVTELAAPRALGGATSVAIAAVRAAQKKDARAWCAWIDPEGTLYAPGVARAGVDLARLLVVRPPREDLARVSVKVVGARALDVVVIDMDPILGAPAATLEPARHARARRPIEPDVLVRKLALVAEEAGARVLLVTDRSAPRRAPWPVALRLELERAPESLTVRVAKDKRGRIGLKKTIPIESVAAERADADVA